MNVMLMVVASIVALIFIGIGLYHIVSKREYTKGYFFIGWGLIIIGTEVFNMLMK